MVFLNRRAEQKSQATAPAGAPTDAKSAAGRPVTGTAPTTAIAADEMESVIGNDFSIEGQTITIRCKGSLRVNGNIQANLHSRRLIVGEGARISGAIVAEDVAVLGQVEGSISGAMVRLEPSAVVDGDILAHKLSIDTGAKFEGRSHWVDDPSEIAPQVDPPLQAGHLHDAPPATGVTVHGAPRVPSNNEASSVASRFEDMRASGILTPPPARVFG